MVQHKKTENSNKRLKIMENTLDGFIISDEDLKMRGPGDFFGTKQHGFIKSKVVDFNEEYLSLEVPDIKHLSLLILIHY